MLSGREHLDFGAAQLQNVGRTRPAGVALALLVAFAAYVAVYRLYIPVYGDMYFQLPEGLEILAGRFPHTVPYGIGAGVWIDHEWLFEAFIAWCWTHGLWTLCIGLCDLAYVAFPLALYALLRREHDAFASGAVALLAFMGEAYTSPYRPQTFAYYLFALTLFALRLPRPKIWLVFALGTLWANLHASAAYGPALAAIAFGGAALERAPRERLVRLALCVPAASVATLLTPSGFALWTYALQYVLHAPFRAYILEWTPLSFGDVAPWIAFVPALVIVALGRSRTAMRPTDALLLAVFAIFAASQQRQIAFLIPATAPLLAASLDGLAAPLAAAVARYERLLRRAAWAVAAAAVAIAAIAGARPLADARGNFGMLARDEVWLAARIGLHGNAYVDRPIAAYLPYAGFPVRLFVDTHADPYGDAQWRDVYALETVRPGFAAVLQRYDLRSAIVQSDGKLAAMLSVLPGWREAARHGRMTAFVRT